MHIDINALFDELYPLNRSILGSEYRKSLEILSKYINLKFSKFKSGTKVFDWVVPQEWEITDGYIIDPKGKKIVDFKKNNLSVMSYSTPINKTLSLEELYNNLYSLKDYPDFIPYVTSYYQKNWGFSIKHSEKNKLQKGKYKAVIKSKFKDGFLMLGESNLKGTSNEDILITSYLCHPSMANNELSGPLVLTGLYNKIKLWKNRKYNYRFLINPETIGSICYIYRNKKSLKNKLNSGLVLTCLGGPTKKLSYKLTRSGNSQLDKLFRYMNSKKIFKIREFDPSSGSDERQYNSSELNLPIGQVSRTIYGEYKEYHTSADDKAFMNIKSVDQSIDELNQLLLINEHCSPLIRYEPNCEIQLGKRGLYDNISFNSKKTISNSRRKKIISYILSYADGKHDIIDLAYKTRISINEFVEIKKVLVKYKILLK